MVFKFWREGEKSWGWLLKTVNAMCRREDCHRCQPRSYKVRSKCSESHRGRGQLCGGGVKSWATKHEQPPPPIIKWRHLKEKASTHKSQCMTLLQVLMVFIAFEEFYLYFLDWQKTCVWNFLFWLFPLQELPQCHPLSSVFTPATVSPCPL